MQVSARLLHHTGKLSAIELNASECQQCLVKGACGGGDGGFRILREGGTIDSDVGQLEAGTMVTLSVPDGTVGRAALLAYGVPLLWALGGAIVFSWIARSNDFWDVDLAALTGCAAGLVIGFGLLRRDRAGQVGPTLRRH